MPDYLPLLERTFDVDAHEFAPAQLWGGIFGPAAERIFAICEPLIDGLGAEMLVTQDPPAGLNDHPLGFEDAVREAR